MSSTNIHKMLRLPALYFCKNTGVQLSSHSITNPAAVASTCCARYLSSSSRKLADSPNQDYVVSPVYHNRNPRNLEKLALARKRIGWKFQAPNKEYYHKLMVIHSLRHTDAWVEHSTGEKVLSASTREWAIRNQLYNCTGVAACASIGQILARRCLQSGITCLFFDETDLSQSSEKNRLVIQAFKDANISLKEPDMIKPMYKPGINYDGYNRYAEPKVWKEDYQDV